MRLFLRLLAFVFLTSLAMLLTGLPVQAEDMVSSFEANGTAECHKNEDFRDCKIRALANAKNNAYYQATNKITNSLSVENLNRLSNMNTTIERIDLHRLDCQISNESRQLECVVNATMVLRSSATMLVDALSEPAVSNPSAKSPAAASVPTSIAPARDREELERLQKAEAERLAQQSAAPNPNTTQNSTEPIPPEPSRAIENGATATFKAQWKLAHQGDARAQYYLGQAYENGEFLDKDHNKALEWYQKSAAQGNDQAQLALAINYETDESNPESLQKAIHYYQLAADQNNSVAQVNLGWLYNIGKGVPKDLDRAFALTAKAAENSNSRAQKNLALFYFARKDFANTVFWLKKSAEQGNARGQRNLGWMYEYGKGVKRDYAIALYWYNRAVDQKLAAAYTNMGEVYLVGHGVRRDSKTANQWFTKGAQAGDQTSQKYLRDQGLSW
ncbi:MAG: tetratricopeptide repeat protein [Alphaproteobacteria bacterium]|nr:tetratricopeptide repeat protein [Alphaproteobacteria bacterium]